MAEPVFQPTLLRRGEIKVGTRHILKNEQAAEAASIHSQTLEENFSLRHAGWASRAPDALKSAFSWLMTTGQTVRWATQEVVLRRMLQNHPRVAAAADIGCGGGHYLLDLLVPVAGQITGIDIFPENLRIAERRVRERNLSDRVRILNAGAEAIPLEDESVDLILCTEVLEHLPDSGQAVREIRRILRNGGSAILSIPIPPDPYPNPEHLHDSFLPADLEALLAANNFSIVDRATCMFAATRAVLWLTQALRIPLPLVPICRLEQATSSWISWPRPYNYICSAVKLPASAATGI
jgi:ubiquinone/menaquinone biosynthesis C-methylase UbiE